MTVGHVAVPHRDRGAARRRLQQHFDLRIRIGGGEFGGAPRLDDAPARLELEIPSGDVAVPHRERGAFLRGDLRLLPAGDLFVAAAAQPSVVDVLWACRNKVGYRELEWHCAAPSPIVSTAGIRPLNRTRCKSGAGFCTATLVFVPWLPVVRAFRKKIEEMPDRAEIIPRPERCVRDADDFSALFLEHGYARQPAAVAPVAHVGGERGIAMRYHAEAPAARCLEFLLRLRIVGRWHDEGGATLAVRRPAVKAVGP